MATDIWKVNLAQVISFRLANEFINEWNSQRLLPVSTQNWPKFIRSAIIVSSQQLDASELSNEYISIIKTAFEMAIDKLEKHYISEILHNFCREIVTTEFIRFLFETRKVAIIFPEQETVVNAKNVQLQLIQYIQANPFFAQKNDGLWMKQNWPLLLKSVVDFTNENPSKALAKIVYSSFHLISDANKQWTEFAPMVFACLFPQVLETKPQLLEIKTESIPIVLISPKIDVSRPKESFQKQDIVQKEIPTREKNETEQEKSKGDAKCCNIL
jgi:hypothetical protein